MKFYRLLVAFLATVAILVVPAPAATAAPGGYVVTGTMVIDCFGCGAPSHGSFDASLTGVPSGSIHGEFTASTSVGGFCNVSFSASGTVTGALNADFTLTYVFPGTLVMTLNAGAHVWVGAAVAAGIDCGFVRVYTFAAAGAGI